MQECYNLYVKNKYITTTTIELDQDDCIRGEPPSEITNDGIKFVLANEDENFVE